MTPFDPVPLERVSTGIPGVDRIAGGGLPVGRNTLVHGVAGAGKTVFATQFLVEGVRQFGQPGVYVTLGEPVADLERNAEALGWDLGRWEREGSWRWVDVSPATEAEVVTGGFDFSGLATRIVAAIREIGARRLVIDSISAAFTRYEDVTAVRWALHGLLATLAETGVTAVLTIEGDPRERDTLYLHMGEHATDSIIRLRYDLAGEHRRRSLEVVKVRGGSHRTGPYPFTIRPVQGIVAIPLGGVELTQEVSDERVSTGDDVLDEMTGGGFFSDSVVLVAGATGTGKSLVAAGFAAQGLAEGGRVLVVGFEESAGQVRRNARNWRLDLETGLADGRLRLLCRYPESASLEEHLVEVIAAIDQLAPDRLVLDSLTAIERISDEKPMREFVMALTGLVKQRRITGLYTAATELFGTGHPTGAHVSVLSDCIVVLRYAESHAELKRVVSVLKMRGSSHDQSLRAFTIDDDGLHVGSPLVDVADILTSVPRGGRDTDRRQGPP